MIEIRKMPHKPYAFACDRCRDPDAGWGAEFVEDETYHDFKAVALCSNCVKDIVDVILGSVRRDVENRTLPGANPT